MGLARTWGVLWWAKPGPVHSMSEPDSEVLLGQPGQAGFSCSMGRFQIWLLVNQTRRVLLTGPCPSLDQTVYALAKTDGSNTSQMKWVLNPLFLKMYVCLQACKEGFKYGYAQGRVQMWIHAYIFFPICRDLLQITDIPHQINLM